ncbi:MAG TPA: hypothetical protein VGW96_06030 [Candidatus Eremiobacteraceae bacterium]|nr:hypothetical protein [Candidatus Eremiobacteraceae bacterium]
MTSSPSMKRILWHVMLGASTAALLCVCRPAFAAVDAGQAFPAARADAPPKFDPTLSDPAWRKAVTAQSFQNLTTRKPAPLDTTAYLLYDSRNLYVAFIAHQDGVPIHASQTTNNIGFGQDDLVGVGIDTAAGQQVYYFEVTPRGVRYQQSAESSRYAPTWEAQTSVNGSTWTAMLTIPLKDLRATGGKNRAWRINFIRNVAGVAEHYTWAWNGLMGDGQPPNWPAFLDARWWPTLNNLEIPNTAARPQPRAEMYGLESIGLDRNVFQQANNTFGTQQARHYGIDFVYPITSTIAGVGTLNPDFSNVEVDQQTIVPQEFQRNLVEYRPFFAQGAQFFTNNSFGLGGNIAAQDQVLYTPSIGTFDRGFKVEGTYGDQSIGALQVRSTATGGILDDQAIGFKHALPDRTFLYWAYGVDAHHSIGNDSTLESGVAGRNLATGFVWGYDQSLEQRRIITDPTTFAFGRSGFIDVHKPNYEWNIGYLDVSPGYGPLDGFTNVNDIRGPVGFADFQTTALGAKTWTGFFTVDRFLTRTGSVHQADFFGVTDFYTKNLFHINLLQQSSSLDDPVITGGVNLPFNQSSFTLGYKDGTSAPFDVFYGAGPFSTFYLQQFNVFTTRPIGTHFNLSLTYAGTHERSPAIGVDGQILRSIAIGESLGPETNLTLALRGINGNGGFASPGVNLAAALHNRFRSGSELFLSYGTPAAPATLNRVIIKYLWRVGGGAGT